MRKYFTLTHLHKSRLFKFQFDKNFISKENFFLLDKYFYYTNLNLMVEFKLQFQRSIISNENSNLIY